MANLNSAISAPPEPDKDGFASIHVKIGEIKSVLAQKKRLYCTDRHGTQVDIGGLVIRLMRSLESLAKVIDVAIQHRPEVSALVWASSRFILMVDRFPETFVGYGISVYPVPPT